MSLDASSTASSSSTESTPAADIFQFTADRLNEMLQQQIAQLQLPLYNPYLAAAAASLMSSASSSASADAVAAAPPPPCFTAPLPPPPPQDPSTSMQSLLLDMLQQQSLASSIASSHSLGLFSSPTTTTTAASNLSALPASLASHPYALPSAILFSGSVEQRTASLLALNNTLMRPRVNSAASSSGSSSSLSSPNLPPLNSPERRRKRARSMLTKSETLAAHAKTLDAASKVARVAAAAETIEDEEARRELAAKVMADCANGTLPAMLKPSAHLPSSSESAMIDAFPKITLRPLIPESKLPESVGPDSPFRHHPKYQKKRAAAEQDMLFGQSFAGFSLSKSAGGKEANGMPTDPEMISKMFDKFMSDVISHELVASN